MHSLLSKGVAAVLASGAFAASAFGIYSVSKTVTVREALLSDSAKFLIFEIKDNTVEEGWEAKWTSYKSAQKDKFSGVEISSDSSNKVEDVKKLKQACSNLLDSHNSDQNINLFKQWCMKSS